MSGNRQWRSNKWRVLLLSGRGSHHAEAEMGPDYKYCLNNRAYYAPKLSVLYNVEVSDDWVDEVNRSQTSGLEYYGASFYAGSRRDEVERPSVSGAMFQNLAQ